MILYIVHIAVNFIVIFEAYFYTFPLSNLLKTCYVLNVFLLERGISIEKNPSLHTGGTIAMEEDKETGVVQPGEKILFKIHS